MLRKFILLTLLAAFCAQPLFAQVSPSNKNQPKARAEKKSKRFTVSKPNDLGSGPNKLVKTAVTPELDIYLPASFAVLPDEGIAQKYPSWKKPKAVYSDPQGNVDFIVTERRTDFRAADSELLQKFYKASILNMYSEVEFLSERTEYINGREYVVLEFLSSMNHEDPAMKMMKPLRKYTYIMYTVDNASNKMVVLTLQAPLELRETWQPIAPNIMMSAHLKKLSPGTVERGPNDPRPVKIKQPQQTQQPPQNTLKK